MKGLHYIAWMLLVLQTVLLIWLLVQTRRHSRERSADEPRYAQITHAARLAIIGEIASSIAHQVTQPLSAILSNVETAALLLRRPKPDIATVLQILEDVCQDDLRADGFVRRLRTLLHRRELQFEAVDVNALVSGVLSIAMPEAVRRSIVIHTSLDASLPRAAADPVYLQQVLLHLLINAMDAMNDTPVEQRVLELRTERCDGAHLLVTVLDRGHGFAQEQKDKLFESFYTTKSEGLGLGLAIARSIISMHGGAIWAENRRNGGAAFAFTVHT